MGFSSIVVTLGSISGPVLAGVSYDQTGSYTIGFTGLAILAALGSLFLYFLPAPQDARRATSVEGAAG
jgi:MFS-type transporter involved in bile tolerance (Atg22 family)